MLHACIACHYRTACCMHALHAITAQHACMRCMLLQLSMQRWLCPAGLPHPPLGLQLAAIEHDGRPVCAGGGRARAWARPEAAAPARRRRGHRPLTGDARNIQTLKRDSRDSRYRCGRCCSESHHSGRKSDRDDPRSGECHSVNIMSSVGSVQLQQPRDAAPQRASVRCLVARRAPALFPVAAWAR